MKQTILTIAILLVSLFANAEGFQRTVVGNYFAQSAEMMQDSVFTTEKNDSGIKLKFVGNLYIAPENWSKVGMSGDPKFGLGLGGMVGLGIQIDDIIVGAGPHFGINRWEADYSNKPQSATSSVFYELTDMGIEGVFYMLFGKSKMAIILGTGQTEISSGYVVDGQTIPYYDTDGKKESYHNVGIGFFLGKIQIAPNYVRYTGLIKDAERLEIRIGFAL